MIHLVSTQHARSGVCQSLSKLRRFRFHLAIIPMGEKIPWSNLVFLATCLVIVILFLFGKFLIWLGSTKPIETQTELIITSTNNRGLNYVSSATSPDRHVIVQIPEEIEKSKPPAYSNFSPPSYEEAFEMFKKSGHNARWLDEWVFQIWDGSGFILL